MHTPKLSKKHERHINVNVNVSFKLG